MVDITMFIRRVLRKVKKEIQNFKYGKKIPVYIPVIQGELLKNKTVLITGATAGIGLELAKSCIKNGANIIITGRNLEKIVKTCEELKAMNGSENIQIFGFELDVMNAYLLKEKAEQIFINMGNLNIDIWVNNAGIVHNSEAISKAEEFNDVINTNLRGMYLLSEIIAEYMIKNNIKGNILNVLSSSSLRPAISPYAMSKWAGLGLTKGLAKKLIKHDIVVNAIAPGPTATSLIGASDENLTLLKSPAGRYTTTVEVANLSVILISDMGRMIVGDTLFVTGGCGNLTVDDVGY